MIHPFRFYRTHLKLSQSDMASRIASSDAAILSLTNSNTGTISTQYYRRLEKGMVNPATDWDAVLAVFKDHLFDDPEWETLVNKYDNLLILQGDDLAVESPLLVENHRLSDNLIVTYLGYQLLDWYLLTRLKVRRKLEERFQGAPDYRERSPVSIRESVTSLFGLPNTDYSFSLIMGLHIFSVQQWTKENKPYNLFNGSWPAPVYQALLDIGVL